MGIEICPGDVVVQEDATHGVDLSQSDPSPQEGLQICLTAGGSADLSHCRLALTHKPKSATDCFFPL